MLITNWVKIGKRYLVEGETMVFNLFLIFFVWLLILFLMSSFWLELVIEKSTIKLRLGIGWQCFRRRIKIPVYYFHHRVTRLPKRATTQTSATGLTMSSLVNLSRLSRIFLQSILPHVTMHVQAAVTVGTGDAAATGLRIGIIWQLLGFVNAFMQTALTAGHIDLKLKPEFNVACLEANIRCIVFLPMFHIITATVQTIKYWFRIRPDLYQGGKK